MTGPNESHCKSVMVDAVHLLKKLFFGDEMEFAEMTQKIIGCAFQVYNTLGFGYLESVYKNSMMIELRNAGLKAEQQKPIHVYYQGKLVGNFIADIIADDLIILELKSVRQISKEFEVQLVNYLTTTMKPIGLLLNFAPVKIEIKRKVRVLPEK